MLVGHYTRNQYCPSVNIVARAPNVYTPSAILTAWYFTLKEIFYGDFMSPATIKRTNVVMKNTLYFSRFQHHSDILGSLSRNRFQYQTSRKSVQR